MSLHSSIIHPMGDCNYKFNTAKKYRKKKTWDAIGPTEIAKTIYDNNINNLGKKYSKKELRSIINALLKQIHKSISHDILLDLPPLGKFYGASGKVRYRQRKD